MSKMKEYIDLGRREFMNKLEPIMSPKELEAIETAYILAKYGHRGQERDDGTRYFEHPKSVAHILIEELQINDSQTIIMALLHDVLEDSHILSPYRIELNFGKEVVIGLKLLTKKPKTGYLKRLSTYGDNKTILVKLCDRLHNLRTLKYCTKKKQQEQIEETESHLLPLVSLLIKRLPKKDKWRGEYIQKEIELICKKYK
ncbi:bifunctional (p)ppGpp synthetase/guanosine-3',5'-bis(diphosphate) 3'-pyrophosphohydrolase [Candidatus Parcubacteria bacterium]|jgi:(p)ppGpp synthase/HD superfamily hydrolase|nr:MAG: bifunctional (p)ppGpp synthetase/guanosine-3',5'-bis(diphosphate) 3'-pyrophosphohydrolase [Candidatus Parcubacteria bacterium]